MKWYQKAVAAGVVAAGLMGLYNCGSSAPKTTSKPPTAPTGPKPPAVPTGPNQYEQTLRGAKKITISELTFSMGKDYNILVDDKKVATVTGKDVRIMGGDVFTLKTIDDKVLAYEKEHKRFFKLNRAASIYDGNNKLVGYFGEEKLKNLFSVSYVFHIYDENQKEIGKSKKLGKSALGKHELFDNKGNIDYKIDKHFTLGGDKYTVEILDPKSDISVWAAILLVCIEDAIGDAN